MIADFMERGTRSHARVVAACVLPEPDGPELVQKCVIEVLQSRVAQMPLPKVGRTWLRRLNFDGALASDLWRTVSGISRYWYLYSFFSNCWSLLAHHNCAPAI